MSFRDFFDSSKPSKIYALPKPKVGTRAVNKDELDNTYYVEEDIAEEQIDDFKYVEELQKREEAECMANYLKNAQTADIMNVENCPTIDDAESKPVVEIYKQYQFCYQSHNSLAIMEFQEKIMNMISTSFVSIIHGPTGCGKSTQVPQWILEQCHSNNKYCNIVVTQPRRIAAISVAKRVAEERGWSLGTVVGYQVGLDNKTSSDTILTYMTTGVLLQKLITWKGINKYTHIILDEVHERDQEIDFLMLLVRRYLRTTATSTKVVLMSATFDVDKFAEYFVMPRRSGFEPASVLDITTKKPYQVRQFYLNQFQDLVDPKVKLEFTKEEPVYFLHLKMVVFQLLNIFNKFDEPNNRGAVLIFLPGIHEIEDVYELLSQKNNGPVKWVLVPLHSSITIEEQRQAFEKPRVGERKIILSTNIAESSVTVPDVVYVIDYCLTKTVVANPATNYSSLQLMWASHTNCEQRAGRVGRVSPGVVYRLVPRTFYDEEMDRFLKPEILRCPLNRLVLLAKMLELDLPPQEILGLALDQPSMTNILQTVAQLKVTGALLPTCKGIYTIRDGDLTYLGRIMALLPVDIHVSKLIVLGYIFGTFREAIIMGAAMSLQNIFTSPFHERLAAYTTKLHWAGCSSSDLITYLNVYMVWEQHKLANHYHGDNSERNWMKKKQLQIRTMREWRILVVDIRQRLERLGIVELPGGFVGNLNEEEKALMIKIVICGAFYPNYFLRSQEAGQVDEAAAVKMLGGRNPFNTVYFTKKPLDQPMELYTKFIRELLSPCGQHIQVSYDDSSKVYVQFSKKASKSLISGKIAQEVYKAVKYRQLKLPTTLKSMPPSIAKKRMEIWKQQQAFKKKNKSTNIQDIAVLPCYGTTFLELQICHINDPGHFFAHNIGDALVIEALEKIETILNEAELPALVADVHVGELYAAPYNQCYYRAKIFDDSTYKNDKTIQVFFIDYGNIEKVKHKDLRILPFEVQNIPALALECVLAKVQPSLEKNSHAIWVEAATAEFVKLTQQPVYGKIYSVVENIVTLELYTKCRSVCATDITINQILINKGYAEPAIESFLSQEDNKQRERFEEHNTETVVYTNTIVWYDKDNEPPVPSLDDCNYSITLRGPYSPLETHVYSVLRSSASRVISIDPSSVNSVLLDHAPQDPNDRLLVAGNISESTDGEKLILRHTSIMPSAQGFSIFMALLFCPTVEFQTDPESTRITSILCGLGCDPDTKSSYYPAQDLSMTLDFVLTENFVAEISTIRYFMNFAVEAMRCFKSDEKTNTMSIETCQKSIRSRIRALLKTVHKPMERVVPTNAFGWGKPRKNVTVINPSYSSNSDIWPMHSFVQLHNQPEDEKCAEKQVRTTKSEVMCKLCKVTTSDMTAFRAHMSLKEHQENVRRFQREC